MRAAGPGPPAGNSGPTSSATQSAESSRPVSRTVGALQSDIPQSALDLSPPQTRTRTVRRSREVRGAAGQGTSTDSADSTRPAGIPSIEIS